MIRILFVFLFTATLTIMALSQNQNQDVAQLIPIFSETFNLPQVSAWEKNGGRAELKCAGFVLGLVADSGPTAYLTSKLNFDQIFRQRREADKQKGRPAFRP